MLAACGPCTYLICRRTQRRSLGLSCGGQSQSPSPFRGGEPEGEMALGRRLPAPREGRKAAEGLKERRHSLNAGGCEAWCCHSLRGTCSCDQGITADSSSPDSGDRFPSTACGPWASHHPLSLSFPILSARVEDLVRWRGVGRQRTAGPPVRVLPPLFLPSSPSSYLHSAAMAL